MPEWIMVTEVHSQRRLMRRLIRVDDIRTIGRSLSGKQNDTVIVLKQGDDTDYSWDRRVFSVTEDIETVGRRLGWVPHDPTTP